MNEQTFSNEELAGEIMHLLHTVDYGIEEPHIAKEFMGKPDFYGKRQEGEATYEICGLVKKDLTELARAVTQLWTIKRQLGDDADYIIVFPPLNEDSLLDTLQADNNKLFKKLKREGFHIWLCNPKEKGISSVFGKPRDSLFSKHLKFKDLQI